MALSVITDRWSDWAVSASSTRSHAGLLPTTEPPPPGKDARRLLDRADAALGHHDSERRLGRARQTHPAPAHRTMFGWVRTAPDPLGHLLRHEQPLRAKLAVASRSRDACIRYMPDRAGVRLPHPATRGSTGRISLFVRDVRHPRLPCALPGARPAGEPRSRRRSASRRSRRSRSSARAPASYRPMVPGSRPDHCLPRRERS